MPEKQTTPVEVRPNTLQGQSEPNTFRSQTVSGTVGGQYLNRGGGNAPPPRRLALPEVPLRAFVALAVLLVFVAFYLLSGTP
jgi:hypothetical protein